MYLGMLNGEIIYIQVHKSYIYLSYHRGHISSIYLSTTNTTLHGKTSWHIKFYFVVTKRVQHCCQIIYFL